MKFIADNKPTFSNELRYQRVSADHVINTCMNSNRNVKKSKLLGYRIIVMVGRLVIYFSGIASIIIMNVFSVEMGLIMKY